MRSISHHTIILASAMFLVCVSCPVLLLSTLLTYIWPREVEGEGDTGWKGWEAVCCVQMYARDADLCVLGQHLNALNSRSHVGSSAVLQSCNFAWHFNCTRLAASGSEDGPQNWCYMLPPPHLWRACLVHAVAAGGEAARHLWGALVLCIQHQLLAAGALS